MMMQESCCKRWHRWNTWQLWLKSLCLDCHTEQGPELIPPPPPPQKKIGTYCMSPSEISVVCFIFGIDPQIVQTPNLTWPLLEVWEKKWKCSLQCQKGNIQRERVKNHTCRSPFTGFQGQIDNKLERKLSPNSSCYSMVRGKIQRKCPFKVHSLPPSLQMCRSKCKPHL